MNGPAKIDRPTTRAVVKYADELRAAAERQMARDPYAKPYYPTTAAARQLVKRIANQIERETRGALADQPEADVEAAVAEARALAPERAIEHLRRRAATADGEHRRATAESDRSLQRLQRRKAQHARDVAALRAGLTLGQRIDRALDGLKVVAAASAGPRADDQRVHGGERSQQPPWAGDPHGYGRDRAHRLAQRLEALLEAARTRDVEKAA